MGSALVSVRADLRVVTRVWLFTMKIFLISDFFILTAVVQPIVSPASRSSCSESGATRPASRPSSSRRWGRG